MVKDLSCLAKAAGFGDPELGERREAFDNLARMKTNASYSGVLSQVIGNEHFWVSLNDTVASTANVMRPLVQKLNSEIEKSKQPIYHQSDADALRVTFRRMLEVCAEGVAAASSDDDRKASVKELVRILKTLELRGWVGVDETTNLLAESLGKIIASRNKDCGVSAVDLTTDLNRLIVAAKDSQLRHTYDDFGTFIRRFPALLKSSVDVETSLFCMAGAGQQVHRIVDLLKLSQEFAMVLNWGNISTASSVAVAHMEKVAGVLGRMHASLDGADIRKDVRDQIGQLGKLFHSSGSPAYLSHVEKLKAEVAFIFGLLPKFGKKEIKDEDRDEVVAELTASITKIEEMELPIRLEACRMS